MTFRGRLIAVAGAAVCLAVIAALAPGRAQQSPAARALPPNTWVNLQAGGVATGAGVGDEGYSTFV